MGVPGSGDTKLICPICYKQVDSVAGVCPDCGAPLRTAVEKAGAEEDVYGILAQANLYRVRGEYARAESIVVDLLRRHPKNSPAHSLMGDIHAEQGDLDQAIQWYELALDLDTESATDHKKLASVRQRQRERDAQYTVQQLALPVQSPPSTRWVVPVISIVLLAGLIGGYMLGNDRKPKSLPITTELAFGEFGPDPSQVPLMEEPFPMPAMASETLNAPTGLDNQQPAGTDSELRPEEPSQADVLLARIREKCQHGDRVLRAEPDPQTLSVNLLVELRDEDQARQLVGQLAASVLSELKNQRVAITGVQQGQNVYYAEATQARLGELMADPAASENGSLKPDRAPELLSEEQTAEPPAGQS